MTTYLRILTLAATILLTACSLQSVAPKKTTYQFSAQRPESVPATSPHFGSVRIGEFRVTQANRTASILYRETDQRYVADPYQLFVAPPAVLLGERSRDWLLASGLFRSVVPASSLLVADSTLEGEIIELYADVRDPKKPAAVIALRARLINTQGRLITPEWRFSQRIDIAQPDSASVMKGLDQGLTAALADLESKLAKQ